MTPVEIIDAGIERLRQNGWARGTVGEESGPHCMAGALIWAAGEGNDLFFDHPNYPAYIEVETKLCRTLGSGITYWNDKRAKDAEQVISVLEDLRAKFQE